MVTRYIYLIARQTHNFLELIPKQFSRHLFGIVLIKQQLELFSVTIYTPYAVGHVLSAEGISVTSEL